MGGLVVDHLLVQREALVVQRVAHAVALGAQVGLVVRVGGVLDRHLRRDRQPVALQPADLLRVVGEDADARQPEVDQDLRADAVVAQVDRQAELEVGVDRVQALVLEVVGAQLVQQADPAALLGEVEQDAGALALDHRQRRLELLAAIAAQRVEDVAGQALGVDAHEHVVDARDVALDQRDVVLVVHQRAVADGGEVAEAGRQARLDHALDELVVPAPVGDQVGDRDHLQVVLAAVALEVGDAGHRAVVVHDLADHAGRVQTGQSREVDGRLGLAGALEHAARLGLQREDVAGLDQVARRGLGVDGDLDRAGAVGGRDAGGDPVARLDRDRERGLERRLVLGRHQVEAELVAALGGQREADQAAPLLAP